MFWCAQHVIGTIGTQRMKNQALTEKTEDVILEGRKKSLSLAERIRILSFSLCLTD